MLPVNADRRSVLNVELKFIVQLLAPRLNNGKRKTKTKVKTLDGYKSTQKFVLNVALRSRKIKAVTI